jgi:hypothetical protein
MQYLVILMVLPGLNPRHLLTQGGLAVRHLHQHVQEEKINKHFIRKMGNK